MNVLMNDKFHTPFETIPFHLVKNEHFLAALKDGIEKAQKNIEKIKNNPDRPTFKNVMEAFEDVSLQVDLVSSLFFNLHGAESSPELQNIAKEFSPILTAFQNDIMLDEQLFSKIKTIYENRSLMNLSPEEEMLLSTRYKAFIRNGAKLSPQKKEKLREIDQKLSKLKLEFSDHVLAETNEYILWVENKEELKGLPESVLEAAALEAKNKGQENKWAFTLQAPSVLPLVTYADNRDLREKIFKAYASRCFNGGKNDNKDLVKSIISLRQERAELLDYKNHAHFVLEERMAASAAKVTSFIDEIFEYAMPRAKEELEEMEQFAKSKGVTYKLERWDHSYWSEKLKKEKFSIDDELLRPYLKLENVVEGAFKVARKLYGIEFKENKSISVYHPDVKAYTVEKEGKFIAVFYTDFFPREGKRGGAWMTSFKGQRNFGGHEQRPHISIVCNFTKPTTDRPSLLTLNEVLTLFHEFGHALHGIFANTKYESLSGTNVYWDFVELPSQVMENWVYEKECLDLFAEHYQTHEKIPQEYIDRIIKSSNFQEGMATIRQLTFAHLDMAWHTKNPKDITDVGQFEKEVIKKYQLLEPLNEANVSCAFSHIFSGGYSAGYYSYKWAEVLDADAFEFFKEKGIFNKEVAERFHDHVLSKGGSEHPMELYKRFRGKEPSPQALLKRAGLIAS